MPCHPVSRGYRPKSSSRVRDRGSLGTWATLVFPDGAAGRACVRVSSSVSARPDCRGERRRVCPESREGTCVVAAQWDHYCNAVSTPRAYRLISPSFSSSPLFSSLLVLTIPAVSFLRRSERRAFAAGLACRRPSHARGVFLGLRVPLEVDWWVSVVHTPSDPVNSKRTQRAAERVLAPAVFAQRRHLKVHFPRRPSGAGRGKFLRRLRPFPTARISCWRYLGNYPVADFYLRQPLRSPRGKLWSGHRGQ